MKVTILIPHLESYLFLKGCLEGIERMKHPDIEHQIIIIDDNSQDGSYTKIINNYSFKYKILQTGRIGKQQNAGYPLDFAVPYIEGNYVCSLDCDAVPISLDWLIEPIKQIDKGFIFAGWDSGFAIPYMNIMKNNKNGIPFKVINNCYRLSSKENFVKISQECGFKVHGTLAPDCDWYKEYYTPIVGHSDTGVAANYYVYSVMNGKSYSYKMKTYTGKSTTQGTFGQNIDDKVLHMALATRYISPTRKDLNEVGNDYLFWLNRINNEQGFNEQIVNDMLKISKPIYDYEKSNKIIDNIL